jgi:DNA-binding response OmpR family regulator
VETRAVDNFIVRLRRHLGDDPRAPRHLVTVRGAGYRLDP